MPRHVVERRTPERRRLAEWQEAPQGRALFVRQAVVGGLARLAGLVDQAAGRRVEVAEPLGDAFLRRGHVEAVADQAIALLHQLSAPFDVAAAGGQGDRFAGEEHGGQRRRIGLIEVEVRHAHVRMVAARVLQVGDETARVPLLRHERQVDALAEAGVAVAVADADVARHAAEFAEAPLAEFALLRGERGHRQRCAERGQVRGHVVRLRRRLQVHARHRRIGAETPRIRDPRRQPVGFGPRTDLAEIRPALVELDVGRLTDPLRLRLVAQRTTTFGEQLLAGAQLLAGLHVGIGGVPLQLLGRDRLEREVRAGPQQAERAVAEATALEVDLEQVLALLQPDRLLGLEALAGAQGAAEHLLAVDAQFERAAPVGAEAVAVAHRQHDLRFMAGHEQPRRQCGMGRLASFDRQGQQTRTHADLRRIAAGLDERHLRTAHEVGGGDVRHRRGTRAGSRRAGAQRAGAQRARDRPPHRPPPTAPRAPTRDPSSCQRSVGKPGSAASLWIELCSSPCHVAPALVSTFQPTFIWCTGRMPSIARKTVRPSGDSFAALTRSASRFGLPCSTLRSGCSTDNSGEP